MRIPILMYHQIDAPPPKGTPLRGLVVSPQSFARQMQLLHWMGYRGLSMRDLEPYLQGNKVGKVVGITFDDGYQNNLVHALPTLKRYGFTATCYGVSGLFGGTNVWDADKVAAKPLMTLPEWRQWHEAGMDVGSHTRHHADLTALSDAEAQQEIQQSKLELENAIGCEVRHFCYPYGRYSDVHAQMAQASGYVTATTTHRGRAQSGDNLYRLKRIMVARATHAIQFILKTRTTYEDRRS